MMQGRNKLICLLGGLALCGPAHLSLAIAENPYAAIMERNVFALKPPPPPVDPETQKPPPPNIFLTGITTIFGNRRAIMRTPPVPGKPGEAPKEQSFFLAEGQQDGELEVLQIDEKLGSVKIKYGGSPLTLTFEKNGAKIAGAPPAPGIPFPGGGLPPPPSHNPNLDGAMKAIPTRTLRLPPVPAVNNPSGAAYTPSSTYNGSPATSGTGFSTAQNGTASLNLNSLTQPPSAQQIQPNWPPEVQMTAEEQSMLHQVQMELHKNDPGFPGFPGEVPISGNANTPVTQSQTGNNQINNNIPNQRPDRPRGFGAPF
jgi:hypothetical protein